MAPSFVGKTLRGMYEVVSRDQLLTLDQNGNEVSDIEDYNCSNNNIDVKFISLLCEDGKKCSGKKTYQVELLYFNNLISCIATVDDDKNITIITYGKYDLIIDGIQREDVLLNLRIFFKKCSGKYKYKISGEVNISIVINNQNSTTTEVYRVYSINSGTFKFARYL